MTENGKTKMNEIAGYLNSVLTPLNGREVLSIEFTLPDGSVTSSVSDGDNIQNAVIRANDNVLDEDHVEVTLPTNVLDLEDVCKVNNINPPFYVAEARVSDDYESPDQIAIHLLDKDGLVSIGFHAHVKVDAYVPDMTLFKFNAEYTGFPRDLSDEDVSVLKRCLEDTAYSMIHPCLQEGDDGNMILKNECDCIQANVVPILNFIRLTYRMLSDESLFKIKSSADNIAERVAARVNKELGYSIKSNWVTWGIPDMQIPSIDDIDS